MGREKRCSPPKIYSITVFALMSDIHAMHNILM